MAARASHGNLAMHEKVFIASSIIFNVLVSAVYVYTKLNQFDIIRVIGIPIIMLIIPFLYTLKRFHEDEENKQIILSNVPIIVYLVVELLLDYVLLFPFREILVAHVVYILLFYVAEFSILGVSFKLDRRSGFIVLLSFFLLIGCLIYSYS